MNTPPTTGYAAIRPAFDFVAAGVDDRWFEWHVIDRRDGAVIFKCTPPQPHNLGDAELSLAHECEVCSVGLETVDVVEGEEVSEPCQTCGRLGPDAWVSPQGQAEAIAGELNAAFPDGSEPSTGDLREEVLRLRIEGVAY